MPAAPQGPQTPPAPPVRASVPASPPPGPAARFVFRPSPRRTAAKGVRFLDEPARAATGTPALPSSLEGLRDAFTGAPLDLARGLHACRRCTVHYHAESVEVLRAENQGRCMACGGTDIRPVAVPRPPVPAPRPAPPARSPAPAAAPFAGRNHVPDVVTLATYARFEGRVVTFEGRVDNVLVSRRGTDYAVMFERRSWVKGFKLVFFKGTLGRFGGTPAILALKGRTVRVRGLLVKHETYGYQIVVSEPSMLLAVS